MAEYLIPEDTLQVLYRASNTYYDLERSIKILIRESRFGRLDLASKKVLLPAVLKVVSSLTNASRHRHRHRIPRRYDRDLVALCFKLLRNLCAGEIENKKSFLELNGVTIVANILRAEVGLDSSRLDHGLIYWGLQALVKVSWAGLKHRLTVWEELYPVGVVSLTRLGSKESSDGNPECFREVPSDGGWPLMAEVVRIASSVLYTQPRALNDDWLKLLLSRICLEESQLPILFPKLRFVDVLEGEDTESKNDKFSSEQAYLLRIVSEILYEGITEVISKDVALFVFGIFKKSIGILEFATRDKCRRFPSGSAAVDVIGYSLDILSYIGIQDNGSDDRDNAEDVVHVLLSYGLFELLLSLLGDLGPPGIKQFENQDGANCSSKSGPYTGFRRDIVAVIRNSLYRRKHAQDEIRHRNGIQLLLQQCVTDEDNLREWGIGCVGKLVEGNEENQRIVAALGFGVEVDQITRREKLVNIPL